MASVVVTGTGIPFPLDVCLKQPARATTPGSIETSLSATYSSLGASERRLPPSAKVEPARPPARASLRRRRLAAVLTSASEESTATVAAERDSSAAQAIGFGGLHHVGLLCASTERSLDFYCGVLGLAVNEERQNVRLPYGGAWLWVGQEMIHLMELPNPDPTEGRPAHGGRDRHACFTIQSVEALRKRLDEAGISYTMSKSGRPALFTRDPDGNALEFSEIQK